MCCVSFQFYPLMEKKYPISHIFVYVNYRIISLCFLFGYQRFSPSYSIKIFLKSKDPSRSILTTIFPLRKVFLFLALCGGAHDMPVILRFNCFDVISDDILFSNSKKGNFFLLLFTGTTEIKMFWSL